MKEGGNTQADAVSARLREEVARRVNAQVLPWEMRVEIWEEEMCESETTFAKALKRCGVFIPEGGGPAYTAR